MSEDKQDSHNLNIKYTPPPKEIEILEDKIADILSEAFYHYIIEKGLLKRKSNFLDKKT
jgi:hypothetical protein